MYLILSHEEAETRNLEGAEDIHVKGTSVYRWSTIVGDNKTALDVEDCSGLSEEEKALCVDELPKDFIENWN